MKRFLGALGLGLALLAGVVIVRAAALRSRQIEVAAAPRAALQDEDAVVARLAEGIRLKTISAQDPAQVDREPFLALHRLLEESYPLMHARLQREMVDLTLVYTWEGRDPSKPPILLMGHQDVVPVEPGTEADWTQPPFSGAVVDGFLWGRGSIDTKPKLFGICEAVEALLREGFQPDRTVVLAFGHDEEVGGTRGAEPLSKRFAEQGKRFALVLDEGGTIGEGLVPGVSAPVALVGVAEKGYLTLELAVTSEGGHSSMPPPHTSVGIVASAIDRLERRPLPANVQGTTRRFLETVAPEMSFPLRLVVGNLWLFSPVLERQLSASPRSNATIRTTTAATMIEGSVKENVLPIRARAVVNFRILPGDTVASVTEHVRRAVDDPRVEIRALGTPREPSPESRTDSAGYRHLERTIRRFNPTVVVAPNLVLGGTDARYMHDVSDSVYRFAPTHLGPDDLKRAHGTNERVAVRDYLDSIAFYVDLIRTPIEPVAAPPPPGS